jgi:AraC-like DNA-binding protein
MSLYTSPLQFAYFLGLLLAIVLLIRGLKEERLSDKLLAAVLFLLSMEIQDYTFGFSGINFLWEELNGFPRHFHLALPPTVYFYLLSQINRDFKWRRQHLVFYLPYFLYFIFNLFIFLSGKEFVNLWQKNGGHFWAGWTEVIGLWVLYFICFYKSLKVYYAYRAWSKTEFSDTETVSFKWLRNFIYLIIAGELFKNIWNLADYIIDMPYEKDWWWHLFTVGIIAYVGINGYAQRQAKYLYFSPQKNSETPQNDSPKTEYPLISYADLIPKIEYLFKTEKVFLEPELSLSELAKKLKTNSSVLSAAINQHYEKNFNDFVNQYRIKEFEWQLKDPANKNYTRLAIALDCGFNSKATFNRALNKFGEKQ